MPNAEEVIETLHQDFYNKKSNTEIRPGDMEFVEEDLYTNLGELSWEATVAEDTSITINGNKYNHKDKHISIGNNSFIIAPVFNVNENNELLVSNFYLVAEAKDGISEVQYGNNVFKVELEGLDDGDTLAIESVKGVNTQPERINNVGYSGNSITQVSNNGKHMIAITLEADGEKIVDPEQVIYSLGTDGNLGMTSPESSGNNGEMYTYGIYMKYKNGDYDSNDIETRTRERKIIVPGKGHVNLTITLQAQEYKA